MNAEYFPLDIESVKEYGVKRWHEKFFWPVAHTGIVEDGLKQIFNDLIEENSGNGLDDLLIINYKLFIEYSALINSLLILKGLDKAGLKPLCNGESIEFKGIIENEVPLRSLLSVPELKYKSAAISIIEKLRLIKRQLFLNASLSSRLISFSGKARFYAYGISVTDITQDYVKSQLKGGVKLTFAEHWYSKFPAQSSSTIQNNIEDLVEKLISRVQQLSVEQGIVLTEKQIKYLGKTTSAMLIATQKGINALDRGISGQKPINLLTGSGGNHFVRMLSTVVRKNGGTVTSFGHGEPVVYVWDQYRWLEFLTTDKFITFTKPLAATLASLNKQIPLIGNRTVEIEGSETGYFFKMWQKESQKPIPKKIEKVMIVSSPFMGDNTVSNGSTIQPLIQLDWDITVIKALKKAGMKVIYKKHPGGLLRDKTIDFFDDDVEIIYDNFETVLDYADAFLFYYTTTTSFGPALCTNKPIILFHSEWKQWFPEMWSLLTKRCQIVHAGFDEKNRRVFNEDELIEALNKDPVKPNSAFLEKYVFPEKVTE